MPAQAEASEHPRLWNTHETKRDNLKRFRKWREALKKYRNEEAKLPPVCPKGYTVRYQLCHWHQYVEGLRDRPELEQISAINRRVNQRRYVLDPINWKVPDYWESPGEFIRTQGDCEDYAIVKYMALRMLGFAADRMRILVVKDLNLKAGHAVLAVYVGKQILILDNQTRKVVPADRIAHYFVHYSLNENNWWLHLYM